MEKYNLDYLESLINNQVEENLHLDYKASGALGKQNEKTSEISKDVSAMANSDGGIIVYGIKEDEDKKHIPKEISPIRRIDYPKEWLEQIINDKIQPRINGIQIFPLTIDNENDVYIVEIPKSSTAHQAADKKYYKRFNFQSTAMYDYEIRDILNRAKNPQIELKFQFSQKTNELFIEAYNEGKVFAQYLNVTIRLPKRIVENNYKSFINEISEIYLSNKVREIVNPFEKVATYWPTRYEPILPKTGFKLGKIPLFNYPLDFENILEFEIFCDNANSVTGIVKLADIKTI